MEIVGLSGSLRRASYNTGLLRAATELAEPPVVVSVRGIHGIPLYDGDREEREGLPAAVVELKEAIAGADGLLIATPEYNGSVPGPLKNAVDWLSRPPRDQERVFGGKPVALCGATPGRLGTSLAQVAWLPVLRTLGLRLWTGRQLLVPSAAEVFDEEGNLGDAGQRERVRAFVDGFAAFCEAARGAGAAG